MQLQQSRLRIGGGGLTVPRQAAISAAFSSAAAVCAADVREDKTRSGSRQIPVCRSQNSVPSILSHRLKIPSTASKSPSFSILSTTKSAARFASSHPFPIATPTPTYASIDTSFFPSPTAAASSAFIPKYSSVLSIPPHFPPPKGSRSTAFPACHIAWPQPGRPAIISPARFAST